jgi:hypothetical protein
MCEAFDIVNFDNIQARSLYFPEVRPFFPIMKDDMSIIATPSLIS